MNPLDLQQTTTLRPFMGHFRTFFSVAQVASNYDVVRAIRAAAIKRNNVFNMISFAISICFVVAIIAFAPLTFILCLNVCIGIASRSVQFASLSARGACLIFLWVILAAFASGGKYFVSMGLIPFILMSACLIWMVLPIFLGARTDFLRIHLTIFRTSRLHNLWVIFSVFSGAFRFASSALKVESIFRRFAFVELIEEQILSAMRAAFERRGNIQHRNLLSLHLGIEAGAAPRNAVVERFMRPFQAQPYYTIGCAQ